MKTKPKIEVDISKVEYLAGLGLNKEQIALSLGISYPTLNNRQKENKEFIEAIKRGKAKRIGHVANKLQKLVDDGNLGAIIFYLKTQGGYVETQKQIISDDRTEQSDGLSALYSRMSKANKK